MNYSIIITDEKGIANYYILKFSKYRPIKNIYVPNVCLINIYKINDHRYDIKCFFYKNLYIYYKERITSKKELYNIINQLLKENL